MSLELKIDELKPNTVYNVKTMNMADTKLCADMLTCGEGFKYYLTEIKPGNYIVVPYQLLPAKDSEDLYFN